MAGMEQLQIHSKSYLVRWINVPAGHSISWSIQPHKKSLNFGIFKHPGTKNGEAPNLPSTATAAITDAPSTATGGDASLATDNRKRASSLGAPPGVKISQNDRTLVLEKLSSIGLKPVAWKGKCEADKVSMGRYDVPEGEGGMYGLVFDNTFSKQVAKTATFVLMTHPTNAPPKSGHHLHFSHAVSGNTGSNKSSPKFAPETNFGDSTESLSQDQVAADPRPKSRHIVEATTPGGSLFYTGVLLKKRRKRNQGYARRFFSLDYTSNTLSYYQNRQSSALRGAIPLSLAAISANEKTRDISVDSGAEVWHLRANNQKDFEAWKEALEKATRQASQIPSAEAKESQGFEWPTDPKVTTETDERDWGRVEALVGRVSGTRDAVRRLAKDTDPKGPPPTPSAASSVKGSSAFSGMISPALASPSDSESAEYFKDDSDAKSEKKSSAFWKRKPSASTTGATSGLFRRSVSAQVPASGSVLPVPPLPNGVSTSTLSVQNRPGSSRAPVDESIHENVMAILRDLDSAVAEFSALLAENKARRTPATPAPQESRKSIDSASDEEFFDATGGDEKDSTRNSKILTIRQDSDEPAEGAADEVSDGESEASSEGETVGAFDKGADEPGLLPSKPKTLTPLPLERVSRRDTVPPSKLAPPSLIAFLKKNVGKDLSTVAMPVSANEPTSLLQRVAEQMEYSELLDKAATSSPDDGTRILYVMAFAISSFSNNRVKERALRKPFNPMLGETYELVREDKGFRFLAEKVSHRPVRMACQAEASSWTFLQAPMPVQKFWGKSAELNTDGRARVFLYPPYSPEGTVEHYSWTMATSFLRNIIAGEKYVEPVGTMTVVNESTGARAVATFKSGGMFAGRSEDVSVQCFAPGQPHNSASPLPLGLVGKWTQELRFTVNGAPDASRSEPAWRAGALVDKPEKRFGFTTFAAALNEITAVERERLPPTDSRLRADQRAAEEGDLDAAEALKAQLEERQRERRRQMEEKGEQWQPKWFVKVGGGGGEASEDAGGDREEWRLKGGRDGYWEERAREDREKRWEGVVNVLEL
ncbi:Oxysterol-binding protein-domain-containing protein [Phyllosticta citriasiana]|uniref:Oxysterol-binding protein-domain-containing protein n=1 Tax=Phyllosticta citriasiana TaxID=595635 RepID=UPI0030FD6886